MSYILSVGTLIGAVLLALTGNIWFVEFIWRDHMFNDGRSILGQCFAQVEFNGWLNNGYTNRDACLAFERFWHRKLDEAARRGISPLDFFMDDRGNVVLKADLVPVLQIFCSECWAGNQVCDCA